MTDLLVTLAQCSCGLPERRISVWAVLIPSAAVLFCMLLFELYMHKKAKGRPSEGDEGPQGE